jgi:hypothetical protein
MAQLKFVTDMDKILKGKIYPFFLESFSSESSASKSSSSSSSSTSSSRVGDWARGTGYGHSGTTSGSFTEIDKKQAELQKLSDLQFEGLNSLVEFVLTVPPSKRRALAAALHQSQIAKILCILFSDSSFTSMAMNAQVSFFFFSLAPSLSLL